MLGQGKAVSAQRRRALKRLWKGTDQRGMAGRRVVLLREGHACERPMDALNMLSPPSTSPLQHLLK